MSDEDTRSSGGGTGHTREDDKSLNIQTDVEISVGSPCSVGGGGGSSLRPSSPTNGTLTGPRPLLDIHKGRPIRLQVRVLVPIKDHPNYNFVGKLLGPKGNSLKRLQEETQTKMAILGRGSMRDREREEELRATGDPKHGHLKDDLHVEVTAFAPAAEAYARMAHALAEVKRFLVPDYYDDIRQNQLRELAVLNGNRKRGGKGHPVDDQDFEEAQQDTPLRPTFTPSQQQQQRLQVSMNGGSQQHGLPPPLQQQQQQQQQGGGAPRSLRCGLVSRAPLLGRAMRAVPRRHQGAPPAGLVRSFVTSVCARSAGSLFREVTLGAPGAAPAEAARIQYLTEEDAFAFENGFPCGGDPQRADEFELRPSPAYVSHDYGDEDENGGAIYEAHNGYVAAKDFIGEDWQPQSKGSPVQSPGSSTGGRAGPSAGRLKGLSGGPANVRPARTIYREHPYFPAAAVARY